MTTTIDDDDVLFILVGAGGGEALEYRLVVGARLHKRRRQLGAASAHGRIRGMLCGCKKTNVSVSVRVNQYIFFSKSAIWMARPVGAFLACGYLPHGDDAARVADGEQ